MTRRELGTARDVCRVENVKSAHALVSSEAGISDSQARQVRSGASVAASPAARGISADSTPKVAASAPLVRHSIFHWGEIE